MKQKRILIVIDEDGLVGISATNESGSPQPVEVTDLAAYAPEVNAGLLAKIEALESEERAVSVADGVSKLTIMRRLGDKWPVLKTILAGLPEGVSDAWELAHEIRADDPLLVANAEFLKGALEMTDEEFSALLKP